MIPWGFTFRMRLMPPSADVDVPGSVHCHARCATKRSTDGGHAVPRIAKVTVPGDRGDDSSSRDLPYTKVAGVGDIEIPNAVKRQARGLIELRACCRATVAGVTSALRAGHTCHHSVRIELEHAVERGEVDVSGFIYGNTLRESNRGLHSRYRRGGGAPPATVEMVYCCASRVNAPSNARTNIEVAAFMAPPDDVYLGTATVPEFRRCARIIWRLWFLDCAANVRFGQEGDDGSFAIGNLPPGASGRRSG